MAVPPELVKELVQINRLNATLEAELSQALAQVKELNIIKHCLVQQLCSSAIPLDTGSGDVGSLKQSAVSRQHHVLGRARALQQNADRQGVGSSSVTPLPSFNALSIQDPSTQPSQSAPFERDIELDDDVQSSPLEDAKLRNIIDNAAAPRFIPSRSISGHSRTVAITGIPPNISLKEVACKIIGGLVVSLTLLDTTPILKSTTVLVQFFEENAALNFVQYCDRHGFRFSGGCQTAVTVVKTPTVPVSKGTYHNIMDFGATRCIVVKCCPPHMSLNHIRRKLSPHEQPDLHGILEMFEDGFGRVSICFDTVDRASSARARINSYSTFRPAVAEFVPDPCAAPCPLSPRMMKPTMFTNMPLGKPGTQPRPMRFPGNRPSRFYNDRDAPVTVGSGRELNYGEHSSSPPTPNIRRAKPVDYSELYAPSLHAPALPKAAPNVLDSEETMDVGRNRFDEDRNDETTPTHPGFVSTSVSSTESGDIVEGYQAMSIPGSKHAPSLKTALNPSSDSFMPITNRHLGPPTKAARVEGTENHSQGAGQDKRQTSSGSFSHHRHRCLSASDSDSSEDSVESDRAKNRRHADKVLASLEAKTTTTILDY